jgi:hypothetical protein
MGFLFCFWYHRATYMHCSALRIAIGFLSGPPLPSTALFKPIFANRLHGRVIPITHLPGFGVANASSTCNKEAAN